MSQEWQRFLIMWLPMGLYLATLIPYFLTNILTPRDFFSRQTSDTRPDTLSATGQTSAMGHFSRKWLIFLYFYCVEIFVSAARTWINTSLFSAVGQLLIFLGCFLFFKDRLRRRLAAFFVLIEILVTGETVASYLLITANALFLNRTLTFSGMVTVETVTQMFMMVVLYMLSNLLIVPGAVKLLKKYHHILPLGTIALLLLPVQVYSLEQGILLHHEQLDILPFLIVLYFALGFLAFIPVFFGFRSVDRQAHTSAAAEHRLQILQKQLDHSRAIEERYRSIRKWNHDFENHLFALEWLMEHQKFADAEKYLDDML